MSPCVIAALIMTVAVFVLAGAILLKESFTVLVFVLCLWWIARRAHAARVRTARAIVANDVPRTQSEVSQNPGATHAHLESNRPGVEAESGSTSPQT